MQDLKVLEKELNKYAKQINAFNIPFLYLSWDIDEYNMGTIDLEVIIENCRFHYVLPLWQIKQWQLSGKWEREIKAIIKSLLKLVCLELDKKYLFEKYKEDAK